VFPFLTIAVFVVLIAGFYFAVTGSLSRRGGLAFVVGIVAAVPLFDGGQLLLREYARAEDGVVMPGVVTDKLSSTGEAGSRTIGGSRRWRGRRMPTVLTSNGFGFHDVLARVILTGSPNAWVVAYRYGCGARECYKRDFVDHQLWSELRVGQTINIRASKAEIGAVRLDQYPEGPTAIAKLGLGSILGIAAWLASGRFRFGRRRYVTAPAVVTAVDPVKDGDEVHWRVRFAYFVSDGRACESADEISVDSVKPGDDCIAVYPPEHPDLGTLRLIPRA
jgi:hypothetical protein